MRFRGKGMKEGELTYIGSGTSSGPQYQKREEAFRRYVEEQRPVALGMHQIKAAFEAGWAARKREVDYSLDG